VIFDAKIYFIAIFSIPVIFFVTALHGLTPKFGILLMNVSLGIFPFENNLYY